MPIPRTLPQYNRKDIANRSKKYLEEALYVRLFKKGADEQKVRQQLNQFLESRKLVYKWEVDNTIWKLRKANRYSSALQLSEAMEKRGINKTVGDQAVHLGLLAKVRGIAAAENYFVDLPETSKNHQSYRGLLNCYCMKLMTEKAEALVETMKELNIPLDISCYNTLMTLYTNIGRAEKIPAMIQDLKALHATPNVITYNVWMKALAAANDIPGVERVVDEMKANDVVDPDWTTCGNLASIYINAGLYEKAEMALKELEKINARKDFSAYQFLVTSYGKTGNLLEVYRVWRSLRLAFHRIADMGYQNMITVLVKLNDLPGAEQCFREWKPSCKYYDIRVVNALIEGYLKEGLFEKALELKERAQKRSAKPNAKTWEIFMDYYLKNGEFKLAAECVANAMSTVKGNHKKWVPSPEAIGAFMQQFEQEKDVDGAEDFIDNLKKGVDALGAEIFESLIRTYASAGRTSQSMHRRLKMENVEASEATKKLLDVICVDVE